MVVMILLRILVPWFVLTAGPAAAQYDRDGRYIWSPNGIPLDPYARPVPLHPGTPGEAIGTPTTPRIDIIPQRAIRPLPEPAITPVPQTSGRAPLTPQRCSQPWHPASGVARNEFARRCKIVLENARQRGTGAGS